MNDENILRLSHPRTEGDRLPAQPTSVWATGQQAVHVQLADGGYRPATHRDTDAIPPAIAAYAINAYSPSGGIVLDPDCGAGTTIVEALRAGRHTVGLTASRRWWTLARANVTTIKATGVAFDGMVIVLDRRPATFLSAQISGLAGRVDLVLTTLRHDHPDTTLAETLGRFHDLLVGSSALLHPRGHLVIITRPHRDHGHLLDLSTKVRSFVESTGFLPVERCVALTAGLRRHRVITRASLTQRRAVARHHHTTGHQIALPAHRDVLVFQPAHSASAVAAQPARPNPTPVVGASQQRAADAWKRSA